MNNEGWQELYVHIHKAAETMQDDWDDGDRHVPSPSTVASCRLQQWFKGVKWPRTNRIPVDSMKKMESGTAIEGFWRTVYTRAGFNVVSPTRALEVGAMRSKGGDGILYVEDDELRAILSRCVGHEVRMGASLLLELKDFGAWSYCDFFDKGLQQGLPDYYMQVQSYLHGFGIDYCIFHAGMADASGTKFIWRRIKKYGEEVPPFWMEVVKQDPLVINNALDRANEVDWSIKNLSDEKRIPIELRDYDVEELTKKNSYPCSYCGWQEACLGRDVSAKVVNMSDYKRNQ